MNSRTGPRGSRARRWLDRLARLNTVLAAILFAGLTAVVALQVLTRFVLHVPFIWSEEVARFLFFWVVLLGSAMSVKSRRHFVLDIGLGRSDARSGPGRVALDMVPDLCVIAFSVFLLWQGVDYVETGLLRTATNSRLNMALVYGAIPVFAALSIVYATANLVLGRAGEIAAPGRPEGAE